MRAKQHANIDEIRDFDDEDRKIIVKVTPENRPNFYGLEKINIDFIFSQARSLTEKKALPLVNWGHSEALPMDILGRIVQIFRYLLKFY